MYVHLVDPYAKVPPFVRGICWNFVKIFDLEIPEHLGGDYIFIRCDFHLLWSHMMQSGGLVTEAV